MVSKDLQYRLQKMSRRKTGFPIATVAYYGKDDRVASKVVIGIFLSRKEGDPDFMEKWFSDDTDVRFDPDINMQMIEYLEQHDVRRVAMLDRIIGCPHEEGIDYPDGETCPQCPFWANRDRWTGDIID